MKDFLGLPLPMAAYGAGISLTALAVLIQVRGEVYFSITPLFGLILVLLTDLVPYRLMRRREIFYATFAADLAGFMMSGLWVAAANAFLGRFLGCLIAEASSVYWPWRRALIRASDGVVSLAVGSAVFSGLRYLVGLSAEWAPFAGMTLAAGLCSATLVALGESLRYGVRAWPLLSRNICSGMVNAALAGLFGWILGRFFTLYPVTLTGLGLAFAFSGLVVYATRLYAGINELHWSTVRALISALEARDIHRAGHAERVARYCVAVGRKLCLPEWRVVGLYFTALLHEIGMVTADEEEIAGPRSDREMLKRFHGQIVEGSAVLEPLNFSPGSAQAIKYSLTWFNGHHSPDGARGQELSLEARILAVCNAFDSKTSPRPYREANPFTEAVNFLQDGRYTRFDPYIVDIFIRLAMEEEKWGTRVFCRRYNLDGLGQAPGW